jgi:hypothetical protein
MAKFAQGTFTPKNAQKYVGKHTPRYRSGWELTFMMFLDSNSNIIQWASESIRIPYRNPLTGKASIYVPDFLVLYENKYKKQIAELVEIKPKKQSLIESRTASVRDRAIVAVNHAKWASARAWCSQNGLIFRVINENDLFYNGRSK